MKAPAFGREVIGDAKCTRDAAVNYYSRINYEHHYHDFLMELRSGDEQVNVSLLFQRLKWRVLRKFVCHFVGFVVVGDAYLSFGIICRVKEGETWNSFFPLWDSKFNGIGTENTKK